MTRQVAEEYFDLDQQLIDPDTLEKNEPVSHRNYFIFLCGFILAFTTSQIHPMFFSLFMAITFLVAAILSVKDADHIPDRYVDPVSYIILGLELSVLTLLVSIDLSPITTVPKSRILGICVIIFFLSLGLKPVICSILKDHLKKKRCSSPATAVCIGVFCMVSDNEGETAARYFPVWEYTVRCKTKAWNEESIIPVLDPSEEERTFRTGTPQWQTIGYPHYGDERPIMVDPKRPLDVYSPNRQGHTSEIVCGIFIVLIILYVAKLLA